MVTAKNESDSPHFPGRKSRVTARKREVCPVARSSGNGGPTMNLRSASAQVDCPISAVDLFCGPVGLTHGLLQILAVYGGNVMMGGCNR